MMKINPLPTIRVTKSVAIVAFQSPHLFSLIDVTIIAQEEIVINNYLLEETHQNLIRGIETAITMIASRRDSLLIASKE